HRPDLRPGCKCTGWELKGVPVRIEIGSRDLAAGAVTVVRRDTGAKQPVAVPGAAAVIGEMLDAVQSSLFASAVEERERRTLRDPRGYDEMLEFFRRPGGFRAAATREPRVC